MAQHRDHLEPQADGSVAFHTKSGERWTHRVIEGGQAGLAYRLFESANGEQRRYTFGPKEPHDATLLDLREQLSRATPTDAPARSPS